MSAKSEGLEGSAMWEEYLPNPDILELYCGDRIERTWQMDWQTGKVLGEIEKLGWWYQK